MATPPSGHLCSSEMAARHHQANRFAFGVLFAQHSDDLTFIHDGHPVAEVQNFVQVLRYQQDARATGRPLLVGSRAMSRVSRAIEKGETKGLMKIVVDAETRKILGAAILGTGGDEAIHGVLDIMHAGVSYEMLQQTVPIHPTVSELIPTMLSEMRPVE